jgi:hypothetical protein
VHRRTGWRYPLFDAKGALPLPLTTPRDLATQMAHLLAHPRITAQHLRAAAVGLGISPDAGGQTRGQQGRVDRRAAPRAAVGMLPDPAIAAPSGAATTSGVIHWVDEHVSPLDLLDELRPQAQMPIAGQGFLGWCPFHEDRAPDERGEAGTPSFYVVHNRRYGWSWRCLSTNCPYSEGPMKHSFRLLQELLCLDVRAAIGAALARWGPQIGGAPE